MLSFFFFQWFSFNALMAFALFTGLFSTPPPTKPAVAREEPEKIKIWREEQKKRLEIKGINFRACF